MIKEFQNLDHFAVVVLFTQPYDDCHQKYKNFFFIYASDVLYWTFTLMCSSLCAVLMKKTYES